MPHALPLRGHACGGLFRVPARAPSSSLFDCQRASLWRQAHLGPRCPRIACERTLRGLMIWNPDLQYAESICRVFGLPDWGYSTRGPLVDPPGVPCPKCRKGRLVSLAALATSRRYERQMFRGLPGRVVSLFPKTSGLLPAQRPTDIPLAAVPRRYDRTRHTGASRRAASVACVEICRGRFTSLLALPAERTRSTDA